MQSKSITTQIKAIWAILAMLTIWQITTTAKVNTFMPDLDSINKTLNNVLNRMSILDERKVDEIYEELYKEQLNHDVRLKERTKKSDLLISNDKYIEKVNFSSLTSFEEAFKETRDLYGSGAFFYWNGKEYSTFYREELANNND